MSRLVIAATPLLDRWSVTSAVQRDRSSWPPSPDTLFSALVAASASLGKACHPALYWLEQLGNPTIEATVDPPCSNAIKTYCPVADEPMWAERSRQARWHNSIGDASPVSWSWAIETTEHLDALQKIVREVTYIGSSRGPVQATAFLTRTPPTDHALVPDERGRTRLRGIYPGRLDELEAAFQRGERPRPTEAVSYAPVGGAGVESLWGKLIPLRRIRGQALHLLHSVPVSEAVRQAITSHLPDGAPGVLTGHAADGAMARAAHMAIVPLPRVNYPFADGEIKGVGLLLPRDFSSTDHSTLLDGLRDWLASGGHVDIGPVHWTMEVAHNDPLRSLSANRYRGLAHTWASVTPVVFDRHPRRNLTLSHVVSAMCGEMGLPPPERVEAASLGSLEGCSDCHRHALGKRSYLRSQLISHVRIKWRQKVPGPMLLGRGRYFGLGVMLPVREAA